MPSDGDRPGCKAQLSGLGCLAFVVGAPASYAIYHYSTPAADGSPNPFVAAFFMLAALGLLWFLAVEGIAWTGRFLMWRLSGASIDEMTVVRIEPAAGSLRTKVVGVTFKNPDGTDRQEIIHRFCRAGGEVRLIPDPRNEVDDRAIGVWVADSTSKSRPSWKQIGHIGVERLDDLHEALDAGRQLRARILQVTGGGPGENLGVNIEVVSA